MGIARRLTGKAWGNALGGWKAQGRNVRGQFMKKGAGSGAGRVARQPGIRRANSPKAKRAYAPGSNYRPSRNQLALQQQAKAERSAKRKQTAKKVALVAAGGVAAGAVGYAAYKGSNNLMAANQRDYRQRNLMLGPGTGSNTSPAHWDKPAAKIKMYSGKYSKYKVAPASPSKGSTNPNNPSTVASLRAKKPMTYRIKGGERTQIAQAPASVIPADMTNKQLVLVSEHQRLRAKATGKVGAAIRWGRKRGADAAKERATQVAKAKAAKEIASIKSDVMNPSAQKPAHKATHKPATGAGAPSTTAAKAATGVRTTTPGGNSGSKVTGESAPAKITRAARSAENKAAAAAKRQASTNQPLPEEVLHEMKDIMPGLENVFARKQAGEKSIIVPHPDMVSEFAASRASIKNIETGLRMRYGSDLDKTQVRAIKIAIKAKRDTMRKKAPEVTAANPKFHSSKDGGLGKKVSSQERRAAAMAGEVVIKQQGVKKVTTANLNDKLVKATAPKPKNTGGKPGWLTIIEELGLESFSKAELLQEMRDDMYTAKERAAIRTLWGTM